MTIPEKGEGKEHFAGIGTYSGRGSNQDEEQGKKGVKVESERECRNLIDEFNQMVINRRLFVASQGKLNTLEKGMRKNQFNSKPQLSETTKELAAKKRRQSSMNIPTTEIIAEEGEDNEVPDNAAQQSGGGTIHNRLYKMRKSIDKNRQNLVNKGEEKEMKECKFQPNTDRETSQNKDDNEVDSPKKNGIAIAKRLMLHQLASSQYQGKTKEDVEIEKNYNELTFQPNSHKAKGRASVTALSQYTNLHTLSSQAKMSNTNSPTKPGRSSARVSGVGLKVEQTTPRATLKLSKKGSAVSKNGQKQKEDRPLKSAKKETKDIEASPQFGK